MLLATPPPAPSRFNPTPRQLARLLPGLLIFGAGEGLVTHAELGNELTVFTLGALLGGTFGAGTVAFALLVGPSVAAALRLFPGRHAAGSRG